MNKITKTFYYGDVKVILNLRKDLLEYKGFGGTVSCPEEGVYRGKILNIDELVVYESDNLIGLEEAFRDSVDDYLNNT